MNFTKSKTAKIFAGFVGLALALAFVVTPVMTKAATVEELTAQINQLMALVAALQGGSSSTAGGHTFSTDLTIGSTGADVTALQDILISGGFLTMPAGVAKGYFGSLTKSAVQAWQTSKGISSTGYVGPITRAALNALGGGTTPPTTVPLCPNGNTLASNCMTPPTTTPAPTVPLCPNGNTLASNCMTPPGTTGPTVGTEGSITTNLGSTPTNNANIRATNDVSVYGIETTAVASDMLLDRVSLQVSVTPVGGSAQNPGSFINTIKAWDGSTMIKSWPITTASFSKDSSDRYYMNLSGLAFNVQKGTTRTITFSFSVNPLSSTDQNRTVTVQGYAGNTQNVRATDSAGFQSYTDMSGTANTRTHTFKPSGSSTLTVTLDSNLTPKSTNHKVNTTSGISKMIMQAFSAKSESGDSKLTKLYVAVHATSTTGLPSTLYLCRDSDTSCASPLSSVSAPTGENQEALLNNVNVVIPQDTTSKFLIAADFPTTVSGQMASTSLAASSVKWEQPDGSTASSTPGGAIAGNDQYMANVVPVWTLVEALDPVITQQNAAGTASSSISAKFKFTVRNDGAASITKPVVADFGICFASSTQTTYTSGGVNCIGAGASGFSSTFNVSPSDSTLGDGGIYTVTVGGTLNTSGASGVNVPWSSANYMLVATSTTARLAGSTLVQTWNTTDWHTPFAYLTTVH